ncbi:capsular polysaccharide synthesis protein [Clostridium saudiense]|jgi:mannosyltransferase OCH1-like enzyme|uniref:Glycosyl transferase n=1 Tax=Clostridium saudiense TaxID=1414720 RepID=A0ABS2FC64_9CLOT|nr:capsular polysaccharide synthesis protein [Clostridium saudiense]MBM6818135.1 glycosyl transferase [Clostridium saudiense]
MDKNEIPRIIHYCWFGGKEKPEIVKRCIKSWKDILVDYEIKEWNESNFDINSNLFVKQAYEAGKFAFVSDFVRVNALYNYGGIYLDTDVEVFKSFDDLLDNDSFWGFEEKNYIATSTIGCKKGNKLIKEFLSKYDDKKFIFENGQENLETNVSIVSEIISSLGVEMNNKYQKIEGLATFYPQEYFSPYDYINCYSKATSNTYAIHHFYKSWLPTSVKIKSVIKKVIAKFIGGERIAKLRNAISK